MKTKPIVIALLPFLSTPAFASVTTANPMPALCNTAMIYAAQTLNLGLADGTWADTNNPTTITLNLSPAKFPISNVKMIDDCMSNTPVNPIWCEVAGGDPVVFQGDVAQVFPAANGQPTTTQPLATVTVTYNRGGCVVDQVERKF